MAIKVLVGAALAVANSMAISETEPFAELNRGTYENSIMKVGLVSKNTIRDALSDMGSLGYFRDQLPGVGTNQESILALIGSWES